jgi:hypothetical protein
MPVWSSVKTERGCALQVKAKLVRHVDVTITMTDKEWKMVEQILALGRAAWDNPDSDEDRFVWKLMNDTASAIRYEEDD